MANSQKAIITFFVFFFATIFFMTNEEKAPKKEFVPITLPNEEKEEKIKPEPLKIEEPKWLNYPAIRNVSNLGKILSDIESHMPSGHQYQSNDKITWAHETSHGLASLIRRNKYGYNGFYVLENRAILIKEPNITISDAAKLVPSSLRGMAYDLYMVRQKQWNGQPLYIFDEWVAYTNGSTTRADLKITSRTESVQQMLEFSVYSISVAMASRTEDPQLKIFLKWNLARTMEVYKLNKNLGDLSRCEQYLIKMKPFVGNYLGEDFVKEIFNF